VAGNDNAGEWLDPDVERDYGRLTRRGSWTWSEWNSLVEEMATWPVARIETAQRSLVDALVGRKYELAPRVQKSLEEMLSEVWTVSHRDDDGDDAYGTDDFWANLRTFEDFAEGSSQRAIVSGVAEKLAFPQLSESGDGVTMLLRVAPRAYFLRTGQRMSGAGPWLTEEEMYSERDVTVALTSIVSAKRSGETFWLCQLLTAPSVEGARYFVRDLDELADTAGFRVVSRRVTDAIADTRDLPDLQCFLDEAAEELDSYTLAESSSESLSASWRSAERAQCLDPKSAATSWDVVLEEEPAGRPIGPRTKIYIDSAGGHKRMRVVRAESDLLPDPSLSLVGEFAPTPTELSGNPLEPYTSGTAVLIAAIPITQDTVKR